jgi:hypothetical protein
MAFLEGRDPANLAPNELINFRRISAADPIWKGSAFFENNPGPLNHLPLQNGSNMENGWVTVPVRTFYDRFPGNDHTKVQRQKLKSEINRELDCNTNSYNPHKYPNPGQSVTVFPARRLPPVPLNGSVCALNSVVPRGLPFSGTNDVAFVVSRF